MQKHNSTYFRKNMRKILSHCEEVKEPILITTNTGEDEQQEIVILPLDKYINLNNKYCDLVDKYYSLKQKIYEGK